MIYGSLQAEFKETKYNGHIHMCGTPVFGEIVVYISKPVTFQSNYGVPRLLNGFQNVPGMASI